MSVKGHVRNIMTTPVRAVGPGTPILEIARVLAEGGYGGVPVVSDDDEVAGFVSETDLMAALLAGRTGARAVDVMSTPAITADEFEPVEDVMRLLRERRIHHLPVVRHGRLVGIVTPSDVIRFLVAHALPPPPVVA
jgi:CBS domain-containing protein